MTYEGVTPRFTFHTSVQKICGNLKDGITRMTRKKTCLSRTCYPSQEVAERAAERQKSLPFINGNYAEAFECPECNRWHLAWFKEMIKKAPKQKS